MKHTLLLSLLLLTTLCFSQPDAEPTGVKLTPAVEPSSIILSKFSYDNPNIRPVWSREDDNVYAALYRDETTNLGKIIRYDMNGNVLSRQNEMENNTYPVAISKYYLKRYPGEKYAVWSYESNGNKTYYINREEETVWFNSTGKYAREVKKEVVAK